MEKREYESQFGVHKHRSDPLIISPSLLAADFSNLRQELQDVSSAPWLHLDIMDGHFVPNISFGMPVISSLRPHTKSFFDVHLMIHPVDSYLKNIVQSGANMITVHVEGAWHLNRTLQVIHDLGCWVGVALCPATPVDVLIEVLEYVDFILVMTVNPGFGGQKFLYSQLKKIEKISSMILDYERENGRGIRLGVDGGINIKTAPLAVEAGADVLVAGSSIYSAKNRSLAIGNLKDSCHLKYIH